jgi:hypothetical protein
VLRLLTRLPKKNVSSERSALQQPSGSKRASSVMLCNLANFTRASKWIYLREIHSQRRKTHDLGKIEKHNL